MKNFSLFFCLVTLLFYFFAFSSKSLLGFWLGLELAGLFMIPLFFMNKKNFINCYKLSLNYFFVSGLSSLLILPGLMFKNFFDFLVLGLAMKAGFVPYSLWLINMFLNCSYLSLFLIGVFGKMAKVYLANFIFYFSPKFFWFFMINVSLMGIFFYLLTAVSTFKVLLGVSSIYSGSLFFYILMSKKCCYLMFKILFFVYMVSSMFLFYFFYLLEKNFILNFKILKAIFSTMSFPMGVLFMYKIVCVYCLFGYDLDLFMFLWILFSMAEQYLFFCMVLKNSVNKFEMYTS